MILVVDDKRDLYTIGKVTFREMMMLPPFTEDQKRIITAHRRQATTAKTVPEAQRICEQEVPEMILLDFDLESDEGNGIDFLNWFLETFPKAPTSWYFHTAHTESRKEMRRILQQHLTQQQTLT